MVSVWWPSKGVLLFFPESWQNDNCGVLLCVCEEMHMKFRSKQSSLVNRHGPILLHDNARPLVSPLTVQKLKESQYEVLTHSQYSPDLSTTNYHRFRSLGNYLHEKRYSNQNAVIASFEEFLE